MSQEVELELTYLAKTLPEGLADCPNKLVVDVYYPVTAGHPVLRLRQNGDAYQITKKTIIEGTDSSRMREETIHLSAEEFAGLTQNGGKRVAKRRYQYGYQGHTAEVDVFEGALAGLVLVDFEFTDRGDQQKFAMPEFCLADVTQEAFVAGGMLAGAPYQDIAEELTRYGYRPLTLR